MNETAAARLRATGISKRFGAVVALEDTHLELRSGEVHALLGANGAGKSTLVKIITGVYPPDSGEVLLRGEPVAFASPSDARVAGVAVVFQDPPLFPHLDVAENIFAGSYPTTRGGLVDRAAMHRQAAEVLGRLRIDLDPYRILQELSVAERAFVAIARALQHDSQVLILDEPTASLTPDETGRLFAVVRNYRDSGGAVLFISHRLEEVRQIADRITIFRDGRNVFTGEMRDVSGAQVVEHMLGRELEAQIAASEPADRSAAEPVLSLRGLSLRRQFSDVTFDVNAGEIVALAGLVGSKRTELVETVLGLRREDGGEVLVRGQRVRRRNPRLMSELGVALVPEDRDAQGLIYGFSIAANIAMPNDRKVSRGGFVRRRAEADMARRQVEALSVRAPGVSADVGALSGGNRQKVVLGKWLASAPSVLLLDEPTKGVDVGAKAEIHSIVRTLARDEGMAVLVVSSDFEEVVGVADRILVMRAGRVVAEVPADQATESNILAAASIATDDTPGT